VKQILISFLRVLLLLAIAGVVAVFFLYPYVAEPSREQWSQSHSLSDALANARSVTFVEFTPRFLDAGAGRILRREVVFQRLDATKDQIDRLRSATSSFVVFSPFRCIAGCFEPHHRVDVVCQDGTAFQFEVCFHYRNFRFDKHSAEPLPASWLPRLRQFFTELGMPPRTDEEYQKLVEEKTKA